MNTSKLGGKSVIARIEMHTEEASFGQVTAAIFEAGGDIVAIDVIQTSKHTTIRDVTITVIDTIDIDIIAERIRAMSGVQAAASI